MADQQRNPNQAPDRGNQGDGQGGERNRDLGNESGRVGTGTERERGTVQEPGTQQPGKTQPDRSQGGGFGGGQESGV